MQRLKNLTRQSLYVIGLIAFFVVASTLPALAGGPDAQDLCESNGGSWDGLDARTGICTYPEGNTIATQACGPGYDYTQEWVTNEGPESTCVLLVTTDVTSDYNLIYMGCGSRVWGPQPDPVLVYLCWGYNGSVLFPAWSCPQSCLIGFVLPFEAANDLPPDALATVYVQLDDLDGSPYGASYQVCFENPDEEMLTLYRYVSGEWRALNTSSRGLVCATASGDGSFYLGPPPS
jgi:hypothetical protein